MRGSAGSTRRPTPRSSAPSACSRRLGALDDAGALTDVGRRLLALPTEPRIARMLIEAERLGAGADGALLAALAGERDIVRGRHWAAARPPRR